MSIGKLNISPYNRKKICKKLCTIRRTASVGHTYIVAASEGELANS